LTGWKLILVPQKFAAYSDLYRCPGCIHFARVVTRVGLGTDEYELPACESKIECRKEKAQVITTRAFCVTGCGPEKVFAYAPNPKALVGLSQRIFVREAREILPLLLIAPTVLSGNLSMASLCG